MRNPSYCSRLDNSAIHASVDSRAVATSCIPSGPDWGFQKCNFTPEGARGLIVDCRAVVIEVDEFGLISKRLSGDVIFADLDRIFQRLYIVVNLFVFFQFNERISSAHV